MNRMMNSGKPNVDLNSDSERDISETANLTGTQGRRVVRAIFVALTTSRDK